MVPDLLARPQKKLNQSARPHPQSQGLIQELRRTAIARSGGWAQAVGEEVGQGGFLAPCIPQAIQSVQIFHHLAGHFLALGPELQALLAVGGEAFHLPSEILDEVIGGIHDAVKVVHVEQGRSPAISQPDTVELTGKSLEDDGAALGIFTFEHAEHLASGLSKERGCGPGIFLGIEGTFRSDGLALCQLFHQFSGRIQSCTGSQLMLASTTSTPASGGDEGRAEFGGHQLCPVGFRWGALGQK